MIYYATNSAEARSLLEQIHGNQSDILTLHTCACGDGHAISDPIDSTHKVVICQTCKPKKGNIVKLLDNLSEDGFAYDFCFGQVMPMPAEYKLVSNTTQSTNKENLNQDTATYILKHAVMLADEDSAPVFAVFAVPNSNPSCSVVFRCCQCCSVAVLCPLRLGFGVGVAVS